MMHPNEIDITPDNAAELMREAQRFGYPHVHALNEQLTRQMLHKSDERAREREIRP